VENEEIEAKDGPRQFKAPFEGPAVVYLKAGM
jgi:hypothetical protein